jgi:hypothetical protein
MHTQYRSEADFKEMVTQAVFGVPGHYEVESITKELVALSTMGMGAYVNLPPIDTFWAVVKLHRLDTEFHQMVVSHITHMAARGDGEGVMSTEYSAKGDYTVASMNLVRGNWDALTVEVYVSRVQEGDTYLAITPDDPGGNEGTLHFAGEVQINGLVWIFQWLEGGQS